MQGNALDGTGICSCSSAYRRFREWIDAGVFATFWRMGLLEYDELQGIDWSWLALDGAMTKAPLGGGKQVATRAIEAKAGSSAACSLKPPAFHWLVEVAPANRHDIKLVLATLASMMCARPVGDCKSKLCLDLGYDYDEVRRIVHIAGSEPVILGRRDE